MKSHFPAILAALSLAACGPMHSLTPAQSAEQADTAASTAYSAIAVAINAYETAKPSDAPAAEAIKVKAWNLLQEERKLYAAGQDVNALLTQLQALETQAKGLK